MNPAHVHDMTVQDGKSDLRVISGPSTFSADLQEILVKAGLQIADRALTKEELKTQISPARLVGIYSDLYKSKFGFEAADAFVAVARQLRAFYPNYVIAVLAELESHNWDTKLVNIDSTLLISPYSGDTKAGKLGNEIRSRFIFAATGENDAINLFKSPFKSKKLKPAKSAAKEKQHVKVECGIAYDQVYLISVQLPPGATDQKLSKKVVIAALNEALRLDVNAATEIPSKSALYAAMIGEIDKVFPAVGSLDSAEQDGGKDENGLGELHMHVKMKGYKRQNNIDQVRSILERIEFLPGAAAVVENVLPCLQVIRGLLDNVSYLVGPIKEDSTEVYVNFNILKLQGVEKTRKQVKQALASFLKKELGFA